jgi:hypothetical protein
MRYVVLIVGILGAIAAGGLGVKWLNDYRQLKDLVEMTRALSGQDPETQAKLAELDRMVWTAYLLLAGGLVGAAGCILAFLGKGLIGGPLMLVSALAPVILFPKVLLFTSILLLGGSLALFVRRAPAVPASRKAAAYSEA